MSRVCSYSNAPTMECIDCGWQGKYNETDALYCPACGGECMDIEYIYGPNGFSPDPECQAKHPSANEKGGAA